MAAQTSDTVLARGNPPLTQDMMDKDISVLEFFLELKLTATERQRFQDEIVEAWKKHDAEVIKNLLDNIKFAGKENDLRAVRETNQGAFVQDMRDKPHDTGNDVMLGAYNRAHPDRGEVMQARGMGQLVGKWETGGAIMPTRDPITHMMRGITATDSWVLNIFSDGRFHHMWAHSHCTSGTVCCNQYGTTADGNISKDGNRIVLEAVSGNEMFRAPCMPKGNLFQPIQAKRQEVEWSLKRDPNSGAQMLCLAQKPFPPSFEKAEEKAQSICYTKSTK